MYKHVLKCFSCNYHDEFACVLLIDLRRCLLSKLNKIFNGTYGTGRKSSFLPIKFKVYFNFLNLPFQSGKLYLALIFVLPKIRFNLPQLNSIYRNLLITKIKKQLILFKFYIHSLYIINIWNYCDNFNTSNSNTLWLFLKSTRDAIPFKFDITSKSIPKKLLVHFSLKKKSKEFHFHSGRRKPRIHRNLSSIQEPLRNVTDWACHNILVSKTRDVQKFKLNSGATAKCNKCSWP